MNDINAPCTTNRFKELAKIARDIGSDCHKYFNKTGKKFVINCYNCLIYDYIT